MGERQIMAESPGFRQPAPGLGSSGPFLRARLECAPRCWLAGLARVEPTRRGRLARRCGEPAPRAFSPAAGVARVGTGPLARCPVPREKRNVPAPCAPFARSGRFAAGAPGARLAQGGSAPPRAAAAAGRARLASGEVAALRPGSRARAGWCRAGGLCRGRHVRGVEPPAGGPRRRRCRAAASARWPWLPSPLPRSGGARLCFLPLSLLLGSAARYPRSYRAAVGVVAGGPGGPRGPGRAGRGELPLAPR